ncbi:hypothetical protein [Endozoicomonas arenosclerae]|uniref:hypothetical protein n=1 Tax=Endozoicomonas arenosclerae TaxID=1633495 RepID=UPI0007830DC0|nr:hypothetical protein [Endozoicomonas arenosclerae]
MRTNQTEAVPLTRLMQRLPSRDPKGQWQGYKLKSVDAEKNIPAPPKWFEHKKKNISERLASYQGALKALLKPLISLCKQHQVNKAQLFADRLSELDDIDQVKAHISELDHQLQTLGDILIPTQMYGFRNLSWLKNEAIRVYLELMLEDDTLKEREVNELAELCQSIIDHEPDISCVEPAQLNGLLCMRAVKYTENNNDKKALLSHSKKLFTETSPGIIHEEVATFRDIWRRELIDHGLGAHLPRT